MTYKELLSLKNDKYWMIDSLNNIRNVKKTKYKNPIALKKEKQKQLFGYKLCNYMLRDYRVEKGEPNEDNKSN